MILIQISEYIHLQNDPEVWGANVNQFSEVLNSVAFEFQNLIPNFNKKKVFVVHSNLIGINHPRICDFGEFNQIYLNIHKNIPLDIYGRGVYQFAHEYCHHLVDGPMDGAMKDSFWFEETICSLASLFMLRRLKFRWILEQGVSSFLSTNANQLSMWEIANFSDARKIDVSPSLSEWIKNNLQQLQSPQHYRDLYNVIAVNILDLFEENPKLWQILPYLRRDNGYEYKNFYNYLNEVEIRMPDELRIAFTKLKQRLIG